MPIERATRPVGELKCHLVGGGSLDETPEMVVMVNHGFGAPGDDLVPIAAELIRMQPSLSEGVLFVMPEAPLDLEDWGMPGARAWWELDIERLQAMIARGELRDLRKGVPEGLPAAREALCGVIHALQEQHGLSDGQFVLSGFSQGSMLATDVALRLKEPPAALGVFSGALLCEQDWRRLAEQRGKLRVYQSHGRLDTILPLQGGTWLREVLEESGIPVEFFVFDGPHTIPFEALDQFGELLATIR